jgi:adenosylhomocysteine nucleosidase
MKTARPSRIGDVRGAPLAIFVATRAEMKPLCRALRATYRASRRSDPIARVWLDGRELLLARTGMGPANAEATARRLFEEGSFAAALALGVAAGLTPPLRTGDLIVGNQVILHRRDGSAPESFTCDSGLQESALQAIRRTSDRYHLGPIATVNQIALTAEEKRRLAAESGAMAVDMESGAIASVASDRAIPFLAIRVILDPVDENLEVAFDQFLDARGEPRPLPLIRYIITHPLAVPTLVSLGVRTSAACIRLGELLRSLSILPI